MLYSIPEQPARGNLYFMPNLNVIVAFRADHIDSTKRTMQSVDDLSQLNQRIHQSDGILKAWAQRCGGRAIAIEAGSGVLEVTADHLTELESLKDQYKQELGTSVSIGVGRELADAQKALQLASKSGGDRIELYTEDTDASLQELDKMDKSEPSLAEVLLKAGEPPALNKPAAGGGMTGPSEAAPSGPQEPTSEGSEHSQNEAYQSFMDSQPPAAEPPDLMGEFSQLAQESEGREQGEKEQQVQAQAQQEGADGMKKELVEILKEFQQLGPLWEELKQAQPEAYKTLEAMMQSMVKLARLAFGQQEEQPQEEQQVQKSEDLMPGGKGDGMSDAEFDLEQLAVGIATEMEEHGLDKKRAKEIAKDHLTEDPNYYREAMKKAWPKDEAENRANQEAHLVTQDWLQQEGEDISGTVDRDMYNRKGALIDKHPGSLSDLSDRLTSSMHDNRLKNEEMYGQDGDRWPTGEPGGPSQTANYWEDVDIASRSPILKRKLQKVAHALEAGKTGRHQVVLPVGSQLDSGQHANRDRVGRIKVRSPSTGKTKWRQVRAGMVMDPEGNPTSSRNPSGGVDKK